MTLFLDASAIVAILKGEPESAQFLARMDGADLLVSPLARFEAVVSLAVQMARGRGEMNAAAGDMRVAEDLVGDLLREAGANEIDITPAVGKAACEAALRYGKIAGHPARLNMGDCFAYAAARTFGATLLYKGDDFAETDIG